MSEPTEAAVRAEVRAWLEANWDPDCGLVEWRNKLVDSGWGMPSWPKEWYGRGLPPALDAGGRGRVAAHRRGRRRQTGIRRLAAATMLAHGTDAQKAKFLRRILTGEDTWCQLFSEPGSGSDLAGRHHPGRVRGRPVGHQRPEGVEHERPPRRLRACCWRAPTGTCPSTGALVLRARHAPARRRGAAAAADERPRLVQPGVLHRRRGAARASGRRRSAAAGRWRRRR